MWLSLEVVPPRAATPDERVVPGHDKTALPGSHGLRREVVIMVWLVLVISGVLETVWAAALAASKGFTRPFPTLLFGAGLLLSMAGLAYALRSIPVGTGYAVWVGIGAVGTALFGMIWLHEPVTVARVTCLVLIVAGVVGLKILH